MAGKFFEVTSLRQDVSTDGRRACVAYTTDYSKDAERRDFTINALYLDKKGQLYDYVGGLQDLKNGRLIFVGDAATRLEEDSLRLLRFFRLTHNSIFLSMTHRAWRHVLHIRQKYTVSLANVFGKNYANCLATAKPQHVLETMVTHGILSRCFAGRGADQDILDASPYYQDIDQINWRDPELRFMGILRNFTPDTMMKIATNLAFLNKLCRRLMALNIGQK